MTHAFSRSLRSIEGEGRSGLRWAWVLALVLLAGWTAFMVRAEVPVYAVSSAARIVTERAVHPIEAGIEGRIVAVHALLDRQVEEGELLFQLDTRALDLRRVEERARVDALEREAAAGEEVVHALREAMGSADEADLAQLEESRLALEQRELELRIAGDELERLTRLHADGGASDLTLAKARSEAERARVAVQAQQVALERAPLEARRRRGDREAEIAGRERDLARAVGELDVARASLARLEHDLECRSIRAPAAGVVGDLAGLTVGSHVRADQVLGRIVGPGRLAVEADFAPGDAVGRVRVGQHGELSLAGFPRARFGTIPLAVERVARETRDGRIRVELGLTRGESGAIPLEHGLPGELRIETERLSPAALVLRTVGGVVGAAPEEVGG